MIRFPELPDTTQANIETIVPASLANSGISIDVLRLDKIHTIISGNKWFKLKYYLEAAVAQQKKGIITFGGAYSNHLLAVAYACQLLELSCIGIVRGEAPTRFSPTLVDSASCGMQFQFVSREKFYDEDFFARLQQQYPGFLFVAEGGRGDEGVKGAEEILQPGAKKIYSHIICAVGTGTMISGIINSSVTDQLVVGIPVLRLPENNSVANFISRNSKSRNYVLQYDFHFGGYAKKNEELLNFMNEFYTEHQIPTDFVYTGKLFFALVQLASAGYFPVGSNILAVHSGGLQGNRSLPGGSLRFSS